jgi:2,3-dihydroxyphenylpropionate 1,2-dioxygenase
MASILGGVMMPHAPQFFTLPDTEDKATVERVRVKAGEIGRRLAALKPDVWIVIANDHANQFLLHCTAPFTLHMGNRVKGTFAGRTFEYRVASELSLSLIQAIQQAGYDPAFSSTADIDYAFGIPLTFLGVDGPVLPVYVNSYVPPQPPIERCYGFGQALARALDGQGVRAVVVASGGMSHFPGTDNYSNPEVDWDRALFETMKTGNLRALLAYGPEELDRRGNVELRSWAIAAGMLGDRAPDDSGFEPSWHHTYATLAWCQAPQDAAPHRPHYPHIYPERVALTDALHALANDGDARQRFLADPKAYVATLGLSDAERAALATLDQPALLGLGIHPLVPFLARLQLERMGWKANA